MSDLLKITLPDGSLREVAPGTTPADIAAAIGPGLAKAAIGARVNGELFDITRPFEGDAATQRTARRSDTRQRCVCSRGERRKAGTAIVHLISLTSLSFLLVTACSIESLSLLSASQQNSTKRLLVSGPAAPGT